MQQNLISASNCSFKLAVISETLSATVFRDKEMCLEAWILSGHNFGGVDEALLYKFAFTKKNLEFSANSCAFAYLAFTATSFFYYIREHTDHVYSDAFRNGVLYCIP